MKTIGCALIIVYDAGWDEIPSLSLSCVYFRETRIAKANVFNVDSPIVLLSFRVTRRLSDSGMFT